MINKTNAKQFEALLDAFIAGEDIQLYSCIDKQWNDVKENFAFSSDISHYRIKPKYKEFRLYAEYNSDRSKVSIQVANPNHPDDKLSYERNYPSYTWFKEWVGPWQSYEGT